MSGVTPTLHEKSEWSRLAMDAYGSGHNAVGHRFSAMAALPEGARLPVTVFDSLQLTYRCWLVNGWEAR